MLRVATDDTYRAEARSALDEIVLEGAQSSGLEPASRRG
jgi:hypothetical protein